MVQDHVTDGEPGVRACHRREDTLEIRHVISLRGPGPEALAAGPAATPGAGARELRRLLIELFETRSRATQELEAIAEVAEPQLRKALAGGGDLSPGVSGSELRPEALPRPRPMTSTCKGGSATGVGSGG